jgi:outer membrane protein OmpA-like peptidoglycan-associated protein
VVLAAIGCKTVSKSSKKQASVKQIYAELKSALPTAEVRLIADSIKIFFPNNVMFDVDQYEVKKDFVPFMHTLSNVLLKHPQTNILVTGHTDDSGTYEHNLQLSEKRAKSMNDLLLKDGLAADRVFTWGLGKSLPIASNKTETGRALNRRAEFVVLMKKK